MFIEKVGHFWYDFNVFYFNFFPPLCRLLFQVLDHLNIVPSIVYHVDKMFLSVQMDRENQI